MQYVVYISSALVRTVHGPFESDESVNTWIDVVQKSDNGAKFIITTMMMPTDFFREITKYTHCVLYTDLEKDQDNELYGPFDSVTSASNWIEYIKQKLSLSGKFRVKNILAP
jgi:hypothetical protein